MRTLNICCCADLEVYKNALLKAELQNKNLLEHNNALIEKTAKLEMKICEMRQAEVLTKQRSEDESLQCERRRQEVILLSLHLQLLCDLYIHKDVTWDV